MRHSLEDGERALASHAWEEALAFFESALAAKDPSTKPVLSLSKGSRRVADAETAALLFGLGRAQFGTSVSVDQRQEAFDNIRRAFDYYTTAGAVPQAVAVGRHSMVLPGLTGVARFYADALDLVPPESLDAGWILSPLGLAIAAETGDYQGAQEAFDRALTIARRQGDVGLEAVTVSRAGALDFRRLHYQECLEKCLRTIELTHGVDDTGVVRGSHMFATSALLATGDLERARHHATAFLATAETLRRKIWLGLAHGMDGIVSQVEGDWQAARVSSERGLALDSQGALLLGPRALLECQVGDFAQGETYLARYLDAWEGTQGPISEHPAPLVAAMARITGGVTDRFDVAEATADTTISSPVATPYQVMSVRAGLALMAVQHGDAAAAEEQYAGLESQKGAMLSMHVVLCDRVLGLLAQTMGKLDDAAAHFDDALAFCRKAGYRPELAWACCDYADMLKERGGLGDREKAFSLLDDSLAISRELGMRPLTERVLSRREILGA